MQRKGRHRKSLVLIKMVRGHLRSSHTSESCPDFFPYPEERGKEVKNTIWDSEGTGSSPNTIRNMICVAVLLAKRKQNFTMVSNKDDIDTAMQLQLFQSIH